MVVLSVPRAAGQNPVRGPMDILAFPRQALAASHGRYASGAYGTDTTLIVADANPRCRSPQLMSDSTSARPAILLAEC